MAGAGSGKTATLTGRLIHLLSSGITPSRIVAITFTNKAASEMKQRVASASSQSVDSVFIGTFHSFCSRLLRREATRLSRRPNFTIFDDSDKNRLLRRLLKEMGIPTKELSLSLASAFISRIKNNMPVPAGLIPKQTSRLENLFARYEAALIINNAFDFDDLISKVVFLFKSNPSLLAKYQNLFSYFLVDEYQDVNPVQYWLIKLLVGNSGRLNVVGDDSQAIYGFRGADVRTFLQFNKDFPSAETVILDQNYRSTKNIIEAASGLISKNKEQLAKQLWTEHATGEPIKVIEHADEDEEAVWLVNFLLSNPDSSSRTILYRTNAQSRPLEQALIEANIPYELFGGLHFYERKEIKDIVAALRLASNPADSVSLERLDKNLYRAPFRRLRDTLPNQATSLSPQDLVSYIVEAGEFVDLIRRRFDNADERLENINELINFAGKFSALSEFLEKISLFAGSDLSSSRVKSSAPSAVSLMTIHMAKGLEFDEVYIAGCSEGLLPHHRSLSSNPELEEERRLMYVAMTRARRKLTLSFYDLPSRFLSDIPSTYLSIESKDRFLDFDDEMRYITID